MLITTNENFQDERIESYLGQVNEQIVVGANIFKDVFASFRDVFGGETKGYKKELGKLKRAALEGIQKNAEDRGANGVIGFRMDIDEISGGNKSMFMLNVFGTAVRFKNAQTEEKATSKITSTELQFQIGKHLLEKKIQNQSNPFRDIYVYELIEYNITGILSELVSYLNSSSHGEKQEKIIDYLETIPESEINNVLIEKIHELQPTFWKTFREAISKRGWFNYNTIETLLKDNNSIKRFRGLKLCTVDKEYYSDADINPIKEIGKYLKKDFNTEIDFHVEEGTFSDTTKWTCPNCLNEIKKKRDYCECGLNRFGLQSGTTPDTIADDLLLKAETLEKYFNTKK